MCPGFALLFAVYIRSTNRRDSCQCNNKSRPPGRFQAAGSGETALGAAQVEIVY